VRFLPTWRTQGVLKKSNYFETLLISFLLPSSFQKVKVKSQSIIKKIILTYAKTYLTFIPTVFKPLREPVKVMQLLWPYRTNFVQKFINDFIWDLTNFIMKMLPIWQTLMGAYEKVGIKAMFLLALAWTKFIKIYWLLTYTF
jgi:hypothetical protein